jgi:nucleoside-diphosphate-sugar epimerase
VTDVDAVVSTLGVTFTREPVDTYSVGTANIAAGMRAAGTRRLIVVSSTAARPMRRSRIPVALKLIEPILTKWQMIRREAGFRDGSAPAAAAAS